MNTDLEKLLAFYAGTGEEVVVDAESPWDQGQPLATVVSLEDLGGHIRFIFDHQGKYLDKWLDFRGGE